MLVLGSFCCAFLVCVGVLVGVAFFTLLERKGLGYFQVRKGPNKVGLAGVPQPVADAVKLFTKEMVYPGFSNKLLFFVAPSVSLVLALFLWCLYPLNGSYVVVSWGLLLFLCVSSLNVYGVLLAGWSSNSKYSLLGAVRAAAQSISYEVSMALILVVVLFLAWEFSLFGVANSQFVVWNFFVVFPVCVVWLVSCFAETNRAPFDFAEGESELVSGFNVEYSSFGFALIFLAEYASILMMSLLSSVLFLGGVGSDLGFAVSVVGISFVFVWVRASFPRYRYDLLMQLTWKGFLPFVLGSLCFVIGFVML